MLVRTESSPARSIRIPRMIFSVWSSAWTLKRSSNMDKPTIKSVEHWDALPIVVDKHGLIIVGDTRYKAALRLGLEQVPVHVAAALTPAQARAYRLADNKTAELADWDHDRLVHELAELQKLQVDFDVLGFSP